MHEHASHRREQHVTVLWLKLQHHSVGPGELMGEGVQGRGAGARDGQDLIFDLGLAK